MKAFERNSKYRVELYTLLTTPELELKPERNPRFDPDECTAAEPNLEWPIHCSFICLFNQLMTRNKEQITSSTLG